MIILEAFAFAAFFGFIVYCVIRSFDMQRYMSSPHYHVDDNAELSATPKIIYTHSSVVGYKGSHKLETVVKFDDGFTYTSFKTEIEHLFGYDRLTVSRDLKNEILNDAWQVHENLRNGKPILTACDFKEKNKKVDYNCEQTCTPKQQKRLYILFGVLAALIVAFVILKIFKNL